MELSEAKQLRQLEKEDSPRSIPLRTAGRLRTLCSCTSPRAGGSMGVRPSHQRSKTGNTPHDGPSGYS